MRLSLGVWLTDYISKKYVISKRKCNQILVLIVTFFVYFSYHLTRRPIAVVKPELHENCTEEAYDDRHLNDTEWCNWAPFDKSNSDVLLGFLDTGFLASYAVFMFVSGYVAERSNLRYFLAISLTICGLLSIMAGMAKILEIHNFWYFLIVQVLSGVAQTTGWPAVVAAVGNWFGHAKKGLLFGIWSWHTNLGNIAGAAIAGAFVETDWSLSFIVPGVIAIGMAVMVFLFLIPEPSDVGLKAEEEEVVKDSDNETKSYTIDNGVNEDNKEVNSTAISFMGALQIPGVIEFSLCLFFAKLVSYTFLYWLPFYINKSIKTSPSQSAYLSISFDIGGTMGAMLAGLIADKSGASGLTCIVFLIIAIPLLFFYYLWGGISMLSNECLQFIAGLFVNGPYSLITTAVSADLATKIKSKSALATVSAIIDGTGSIGAAVGPAMAGWIEGYGWQYVFYMVMIADFIAVLTLLRTGWHELQRFYPSLKRG